jgi:hypothetical protein
MDRTQRIRCENMGGMRRIVLSLGIVALLATACSSGSSTPAGGTSPSGANTTFALQIASSDLYAGAPQRVQVGVFGSADQGVELLTGGTIPLSLVGPDGGAPITGTATYVPAPGTPAAKEPSLTSPSDARGVYQLENVTFPVAGDWEAQLSFNSSGQPINLTDAFAVAEKPALPAPGQMALDTENLTMASKGASPQSIDSRAQDGAKVPDPELHQTTIADAIAQGRAALVLFATPVYCQSQFCGPSTDALQKLAKTGPASADYIHIEIWNDYQKNAINKAAAEWLYRNDNLTEPWLYLIGPDGTIVDRWAPLFDTAEVRKELERVAS